MLGLVGYGKKEDFFPLQGKLDFGLSQVPFQCQEIHRIHIQVHTQINPKILVKIFFCDQKIRETKKF